MADLGYVWLYGCRPKSVTADLVVAWTVHRLCDDSAAEAAYAAILAPGKGTLPLTFTSNIAVCYGNDVNDATARRRSRIYSQTAPVAAADGCRAGCTFARHLSYQRSHSTPSFTSVSTRKHLLHAMAYIHTRQQCRIRGEGGASEPGEYRDRLET